MDAGGSVATPPRPGRRGVVLGLVVLVALGVLAMALVVVAVPLLLDVGACSAAEEGVFAEVHHYGDVRLRPSGNGDTGSCMATYRAPVPEGPVLAHYQQALRSRGWTVQAPQAYAGSPAEGGELRSGELTARRGPDTYTVLYESGPGLQGGGTHVAVHVARGMRAAARAGQMRPRAVASALVKTRT
jgi:hypothetical protein